MKRTHLTTLAALALASGLAIAHAAHKDGSVKPAEKIRYNQVRPGVEKALLWGDDRIGAYGALTRYKAGTKNALHSHANEVRIVVISGAFRYEPEGKPAATVGPASYVRIPAGLKHLSGSDADTTFFEESDGMFTIDEPLQVKSALNP